MHIAIRLWPFPLTLDTIADGTLLSLRGNRTLDPLPAVPSLSHLLLPMDSTTPSRREFLSSSATVLGGGWLWVHLPIASALAVCARESAVRGAPYVTFTDAQGRTMAAFAAQIVPSDAELPGATEAGAVYFVDRALAGPFEWMRDPILGGLADLDTRARVQQPVVAGFADLESGVQETVMREVEATPFFGMARMLTVMGVIADPSYGGNRDGVGARILAMDHRPAYAPPFGDYDAEAASLRAGAGSE